jgi:antitoxin PrlF
MTAKKEKITVTGPACKSSACCSVEALVTVDERGQMVLPKELRAKAGIKAGDKFAVVTWQKDGEVCCIALVKAGNLEPMMKGILGPIMKDIGG